MISKNVYIHKPEEINKYNKTWHETIKMNPAFKKKKSIEYGIEYNDSNLIFNIGDNFRIWKGKNVFAKGSTSSWSGEVPGIKKCKRRS